MAPREFFTLLEDRLISGLGVLQIPQDDIYRAFRVWVDLIRFPNPDFFNGKWNPARSEYAKITFMVGKYVCRERLLHYPHETFDYLPKEPSAFLAPYLVCSNQSQSNALASIGVAVGLPPPTPGDPLYAEPLRYEVDFIRFACRDETALQVRLYGLKEDIGCPGATPNPKRNLEPPDPLPVVPSGDAIEVSGPYLLPDDNGNTVPFGTDLLPAPNNFALRFQVQSWNRFDNCDTVGTVERDILLDFQPTSWTVESTDPGSGCESVVPVGTQGRWVVNYTNGIDSDTKEIIDSIVSPKNRSIVYDSGTLITLPP